MVNISLTGMMHTIQMVTFEWKVCVSLKNTFVMRCTAEIFVFSDDIIMISANRSFFKYEQMKEVNNND
jgi:hypothetical protein